jgi:hypothetical protein
MFVTILVTIDPVKPPALLDALVHSLNLQTCSDFEVVFVNQTRRTAADIGGALRRAPKFRHSYWTLDPGSFVGEYPLWDLYEVHAQLLAQGRIGDYVLSLHMEEFLDADYIEHVRDLLRETRLEILFGNLRRTSLGAEDLGPLLAADDAGAYRETLEMLGAAGSPHWSTPLRKSQGLLPSDSGAAAPVLFDPRFEPTPEGWRQLPAYAHEDVFLMSRSFAERTNWYLRGHHLYLEDIHICQQPGVCELAPVLSGLTPFPVYFNRRRVYHLRHPKFYFQIEDLAFGDRLLALEADDPTIRSLQRAVREHRAGRFSVNQAVRYSRQNPQREGTQDMNYRYHMQYLRRAAPPGPLPSGCAL